MPSNQPIGFFDSGVGGLSIWNEVHQLLPQESTIYLADSINAPYGDKPKDRIIHFSEKNTELLLENGCKIIVVACNTATTNAIAHLRNTYDVPFIGIEPATKPAAIATQTKCIGILATKGTLASELFLNTSKAYRGHIEIVEVIGKGLVQIVESGDFEAARPLLKEYVKPMLEKNADNIVLGCSHYPFLKPILEELVPSHVTIIDSGAPVAKHIQRKLTEESLYSDDNKSRISFYTNVDPAPLIGILNRLGVGERTVTQLEF